MSDGPVQPDPALPSTPPGVPRQGRVRARGGGRSAARGVSPAGAGPPRCVYPGGAFGTSSITVASGRQRKRKGAYLLVPSPGDTCITAGGIIDSPFAIRVGRWLFVTSAPTNGIRTCP